MCITNVHLYVNKSTFNSFHVNVITNNYNPNPKDKPLKTWFERSCRDVHLNPTELLGETGNSGKLQQV